MDWKKSWLAALIGGIVGYLVGCLTSIWVSFVLFFAFGYFGYHYQETWRILKKTMAHFYDAAIKPIPLWFKIWTWDKNPAKSLSWTLAITTFCFYIIAMGCCFYSNEGDWIPTVSSLKINGILTESYSGLANTWFEAKDTIANATILNKIGYCFAFTLCLAGSAICQAFVCVIAYCIGIAVQLLALNIPRAILQIFLAVFYLIASAIQKIMALRFWTVWHAIKKAGKVVVIGVYYPFAFLPFKFLRCILRFLMLIHSWQRVACGAYIAVGGTIYLLFVPFQPEPFQKGLLAIGCGLFCMVFGYAVCKALSSKFIKNILELKIWTPWAPRQIM